MRGGATIFFPFLSGSRQRDPAEPLWAPPTVKLIELVIRRGADRHPAPRRRVCSRHYISSRRRNSRGAGLDPRSVSLERDVSGRG